MLISRLFEQNNSLEFPQFLKKYRIYMIPFLYQLRIIMLRSVCKHINKLSFKPSFIITHPLNPLNSYALKYRFSSQDKIKDLENKMTTLIENGIKYENENPNNIEVAIQFFQKKGFQIQLCNTSSIFSKSNQRFQFHIVVTGSSTQEIPKQSREDFEKLAQEIGKKVEEKDKPPEQENIGEVSVYIQKKGQKNWILMNFTVLIGKDVELDEIGFVDDYQTHRKQRAEGLNPPFSFMGPDIPMIQPDLVNTWFDYMEEIGCSASIIEHAAQVNRLYEQKTAIQWMQQMRKYFDL